MLQFNINSQETLVTQVHMNNKVVLVFHEFRVHNTAQCYTNRALVIINVNKFALLWGEAQLCLPYVCQ